VVPGIPHHITQRGNRRQQTFFREDDYELYKDAMSQCCRIEGVAVWCYCLMPNHTHLIIVPPTPEALRRAVGEAHRRYTNHINQREGWSGFLWQGRFASFPLDPAHLHSCARYIERNPVRAGIVGAPEDWPHSSARAHLLRQDDILVRFRPLLESIGDWRSYLDIPDSPSLSLS
jgi:putative transposase